MRVLLVSDVHANPAALRAIDEHYDACLCMGDLVEYGPDPAGAIDWVRRHATHCVRGNHDHGTAQNVDVVGLGGFRYLTMATRGPTVRMLSAADRRFLADLPTSAMFSLGGKKFLLVHATPRDPLDEYLPPDESAWAPRVAGLGVDYVLCGHTHYPFTLTTPDGVTVVNPGSVGLQRDGNPAARYAILEDGVVTLKQAGYAVDETVAAVRASRFEPRAVQMLTEVYRTGRYSNGVNGANGVNGTNGNGHHVGVANGKIVA